MSLFARPAPPPPVMTPCIGVCTLREDGLCRGCFRTTAEIAAWASLSAQERERIMRMVLPEREAARA